MLVILTNSKHKLTLRLLIFILVNTWIHLLDCYESAAIITMKNNNCTWKGCLLIL